MVIDTRVFTRIVTETRTTERDKGIAKIADMMSWTTRFGGFTRAYLLKCAEYLYDGKDCKTP